MLLASVVWGFSDLKLRVQWLGLQGFGGEGFAIWGLRPERGSKEGSGCFNHLQIYGSAFGMWA